MIMINKLYPKQIGNKIPFFVPPWTRLAINVVVKGLCWSGSTEKRTFLPSSALPLSLSFSLTREFQRADGSQPASANKL